jgi:hypothetical protein
MFGEVAKNLWLLLTIVIPGFFTYGAWRIILLLEPSKRLEINAFNQFDSSALVTTSVIVAIALTQQAFSIVIEAVLALVARIMRGPWPSFYAVFCERFALAAAGKFSESATRTIANFFLSTNICIGLGMLLLYFLQYESMELTQLVPTGLIVVLAAAFTTAIFRMFIAKWVVEECKKDHPDKMPAGAV